MPHGMKRGFGQFAGGGNPGALGFQRPFYKSRFRGKATAFATRSPYQWQRGTRGRGVAGFNKPAVAAALQKNSGELKGMDTTLTIAGPVITTTTTNADSFTLNLIEPGNGSYNRIGRKAFMKSVRISGNALYQGDADPTTGNANGGILRMVLVWDKQPSGTLPTYDVIFGRTSQDGTESSGIYDHLRYDNTARFQVLKDCYLNAPANMGGGTGTTNIQGNLVYFDEFIDLKNRTTVFSGDSDPVTIADISSGALYLYFRASESAMNVRDWSVSAKSMSRLRFTS